MANLLPYILPAALVMTTSIARANFVVQSPPGDTGPEYGNPAVAGHPAPSDNNNSNQPTHWKMAHGFGNNIPLEFACRQIVPPAVTVTYGVGVNPNIPVTWKGGDSWNHVLRDTVKPLGMRLRMTYMAVKIVKNSSP